MTNEYFMPLDQNGYAVSIMPNPYRPDRIGCYFCGFGGDLARHEVFPGPYRQKSKKYGLWVNLCPACHEKMHENGEDTVLLKKRAQLAATNWYGWTSEDFIREFGKNWL